MSEITPRRLEKSNWGTRLQEQLPHPKAVLFDLDDTLISSRAIYGPVKDRVIQNLCWKNLGENFDEDLRGKPIQYYITKRLKLAKNEDGTPTYNESQIKPMVENYFDLLERQLLNEAKNLLDTHEALPKPHEGQIYPLEGAHETLAMLQQQDIPIAIITNSPQKLVDYTVPKLFPELFDGTHPPPAVIGATRNAHNGKVGTRMVPTALKKMGIDPDSANKNIYYIGDTIDQDLELAHQNSMTGILFGSGDKEKRLELLRNKNTSPTAVLTSLHVDDHAGLQSLFSATIKQNRDRNGASSTAHR